MQISRKQFDVLSTLAVANEKMSQRQIADRLSHSVGTVNRVIKELNEMNLISDGKLTESGYEALEPYRVKRAIFIAAGFGSRLVPITLNTPKPLVRVNGTRMIDTLIDAFIENGIEEIYIVRGYLAEQFDQLLYKYPNIKFLENPGYSEANNIGSSLIARELLQNAYVCEADLLLSNPSIIKKYHYTSVFYGIKMKRTDDWCLTVKDGVICEEKLGGEGDNIWQMVGISYWNSTDGKKLIKDIEDVFKSPGGKERYWEQVAFTYKKENYKVEIFDCGIDDIVEIDTFKELKAIDKTYDVSQV